MSTELEITVYDGTERLYSKTIKAGTISDTMLVEMIRCLTARFAGLTGDEIVSSYLKRNAKAFQDHLFIRRDTSPDRFIISCGDSVHTVVRAIRA